MSLTETSTHHLNDAIVRCGTSEGNLTLWVTELAKGSSGLQSALSVKVISKWGRPTM